MLNEMRVFFKGMIFGVLKDQEPICFQQFPLEYNPRYLMDMLIIIWRVGKDYIIGISGSAQEFQSL